MQDVCSGVLCTDGCCCLLYTICANIDSVGLNKIKPLARANNITSFITSIDPTVFNACVNRISAVALQRRRRLHSFDDLINIYIYIYHACRFTRSFVLDRFSPKRFHRVNNFIIIGHNQCLIVYRGRSEIRRKCTDTLPGRYLAVPDHRDCVRDATPEDIHGRRVQDGESCPADHLAEPQLHGPAIGVGAKLAVRTTTAATVTSLRPVLGRCSTAIRGRRTTVARMQYIRKLAPTHYLPTTRPLCSMVYGFTRVQDRDKVSCPRFGHVLR